MCCACEPVLCLCACAAHVRCLCCACPVPVCLCAALSPDTVVVSTCPCSLHHGPLCPILHGTLHSLSSPLPNLAAPSLPPSLPGPASMAHITLTLHLLACREVAQALESEWSSRVLKRDPT